jgi:hypothetical protein
MVSEDKEMVNHPNHYGGEDNVYEAIKVIDAWGLDNDFYLGNAVKYLSRAGKKDDTVQDLKKAIWYIEKKIEKLQK